MRGLREPSSREIRDAENARAFGGMRNPASSVYRIPNASEAGRRIRERIDSVLSSYPEFVHSVDAVLRGEAMAPPPSGMVEASRRAILGLVGGDANEGARGMQPAVFDAYRLLAGDPDGYLSHWLRGGAPLGINRPVSPAGVFPPVTEEAAPSEYVANLSKDPFGWVNYRSADEDVATAVELLDHMVAQGWADALPSWEEVIDSLGEGVVLNKLALLSKLKADGTTKHRLVWDLRRSGVNLAVRQGERVVLPRLSDVVADLRELASLDTERMVLLGTDVSEAFHQIPLHESERRFTVAALGGKYYVFKVLVFGSSSAPTVWGRYAAFLGRSTAAIMGDDPLRVQIYVDDPLYVATDGTPGASRLFSVALLWALTLGYPLAWHKTEGGHELRWIGAIINVRSEDVRIQIPADKIEELRATTYEFLQTKVVGVRQLRSYAGLMSFFAGLVPLLRPFLASIWAVLPGTSSEGRGGKSVKLIHTKRFARALLWFLAFFRGVQGCLERTYPLRPQHVSRRYHIVTDASPWGIGGVLYYLGQPVGYFLDQLQEEDLRRFQARRGDPAFNTVWEALAILVALRCWGPLFTHTTGVTVRSDSHGSLSAISRLASASPSLNLIVAEIALDVSALPDGIAPVDRLVHIPGISNTVADALSRVHAPERHRIPAVLCNAVFTTPPARDKGYWRTRTPPSANDGQHGRGPPRGPPSLDRGGQTA